MPNVVKYELGLRKYSWTNLINEKRNTMGFLIYFLIFSDIFMDIYLFTTEFCN